MVHSGASTRSRSAARTGEVPPVLHWFKWERLLTWISGMACSSSFYLSGSYLLDPGSRALVGVSQPHSESV